MHRSNQILEILSQNKTQGRSVISAILLIINIYISQHSFCFFYLFFIISLFFFLFSQSRSKAIFRSFASASEDL
jgi:hypothetical protein